MYPCVHLFIYLLFIYLFIYYLFISLLIYLSIILFIYLFIKFIYCTFICLFINEVSHVLLDEEGRTVSFIFFSFLPLFTKKSLLMTTREITTTRKHYTHTMCPHPLYTCRHALIMQALFDTCRRHCCRIRAAR
jgi:hypothetical protein